MHAKLALLGLAAVGGALLLVPGCDTGCVTGMTTETVCDMSGSGTIDAPPDLHLPKMLQTFDVTCDSTVVGQCSGGGSFFVTTGGDASMVPNLAGFVRFPDVTGSDTFTVTFPVPAGSPPAAGSATFTLGAPPNSSSDLTVVSGTVTIQHPTSSGYSATFTFMLQAPSGEVISIGGGHANAANCHAQQVCSF
jgi:hypothetical protein